MLSKLCDSACFLRTNVACCCLISTDLLCSSDCCKWGMQANQGSEVFDTREQSEEGTLRQQCL